MPNAFGFDGFGGAPIQVQVQGIDPVVVDRLATQVQQQIATVPGAVGLENSNDAVQTQLRAKIDWTRAADLGISARDAGTALRSALDGFTSNADQFRRTGQTSIHIRILTTDPAHTTPDDIQCLPVFWNQGRGGAWTVHHVRAGAHSDIHRARQSARSVTVGVSAGQGHLVGDLQNEVQAAVGRVATPTG